MFFWRRYIRKAIRIIVIVRLFIIKHKEIVPFEEYTILPMLGVRSF